MADSDLDFTAIWQGTLGTLTNGGLPAQQKAFLRLARLVGLIDSTALIAVPNELTKDVLEQRLRAQVTDALGAQLDRQVRLAVTVDPALAGNDSEAAVEGAGGASADVDVPVDGTNGAGTTGGTNGAVDSAEGSIIDLTSHDLTSRDALDQASTADRLSMGGAMGRAGGIDPTGLRPADCTTAAQAPAAREP
jgi:chromosomal replication initiator protein